MTRRTGCVSCRVRDRVPHPAAYAAGSPPVLLVVRRHERCHVRRRPRFAAAEVARWPFADELGEPRLMFDLLVENGGADGVGAEILALRELAQVGVAADGAAFRLDQDL